MKLIVLIACVLAPIVQAKDQFVNCRFLCFEGAKDGTTALIATGKSGNQETIPLALNAISRKIDLKSDDGVITFKKQESDTAPAVTAQIPAYTKDVIIVLLPAEKAGSVFETLVIDSSAKAFPQGGSLVLNICPHKSKVTIASHEIELKTNESTILGHPDKVDDFNMANVTFHAEVDGSWRSAFEAPVRFLDNQRNLFVAYIDPTSKRPRFWSIHE